MRLDRGNAFRLAGLLAAVVMLAAANTHGVIPSAGGVIDVRDLGALGDDATDNQVALTKAIAALPPAGGAIYVPAGVYRHSGTLVWPRKNFVVFGAGDWAS